MFRWIKRLFHRVPDDIEPMFFDYVPHSGKQRYTGVGLSNPFTVERALKAQQAQNLALGIAHLFADGAGYTAHSGRHWVE